MKRYLATCTGAALMGVALITGSAHAASLPPLDPPAPLTASGDALPAPARAPLPGPLPAPLKNTAATAPTRSATGVVTLPPTESAVDFRGIAASTEARQMARMAFDHGDARGLPFAVVDKKEARLLVFNGEGQLVGATPALLGLARGDTLAPDVGRMVATGIPPALRTTPAGRYDTQPGRNLKGETVIWVDYDAAFAIHRLRPAPANERRAERLASASPEDNRISLGCVIVTGEFFDQVVRPVLGHGAGVVYVLPEPMPQEPPVALNGPARGATAATR